MSISLTYPDTDCNPASNITFPAATRLISIAIALMAVFLIGRLSTNPILTTGGLTVKGDDRGSTDAVIRVQQIHSDFVSGYATVSGEIVNDSKLDIANVQVVTEFFDNDLRLLATEVSVPRFSSVRQGDSVPFTVETPSKPGMSTVKISLRTAEGKAISSSCAQ